MGCSVDTVTLSIEQKKFVECRAKEAGVTNLIRVHLLDYRQLPKSFEKSFDAFISCEMIEVINIYHCLCGLQHDTQTCPIIRLLGEPIYLNTSK